MRTIKRTSRPLNQSKYDALQEVASAYAREKQEHLPMYHDGALFAAHPNERGLRDEMVKSGYISPHGVSGRMWKLAQKEAYETTAKQWAALAEAIKPLIAAYKVPSSSTQPSDHNNQSPPATVWTDAQLRYAYWMLYTPRRMAELMAGSAPVPTQFQIEADQRQVVVNYLRRVIRRKRGGQPAVKLERSFPLDPNMYDIQTTAAGTQVIAVTGLVPRKRIRIPLTGQTVISGNIRVLLDPGKRRVEIHYTAELKRAKEPDSAAAEVVAVDAGLSEVFTDEEGNRYGTGLGRLIYQESERILVKNRRRNKLYQLAEKHQSKGRSQKARHIRRCNLGRKKQTAQRRRNRIELERQINTALNKIIKERKPSVLVTEKLDLRGKAKSRQLSRQVSLWPRGLLQERTEFKASAAGCRRERVNPAYTSQMCPRCGFVNGKNRQGDRFKCLNCGYEQGADRVAAMNLKARVTDPGITVWTPKERVRIILLDRFAAGQDAGHSDAGALEAAVCRFGTRRVSRQSETVTGRTPVATPATPDGALSTERETTNTIPEG
jgi:putative transposase